jgi:CRISPR-associated protein Cas1
MRKVHLVLDHTIASLSLKTGRVHLKYASEVERGSASLETTRDVPLADLGGITVFSEHHSTFSSDLLFKLTENGIPVIFANRRGETLGMFHCLGYTNQTKRRSLQEEVLRDFSFRTALARRIIQAKLENSATFLLYQSKRPHNKKATDPLYKSAKEIRRVADQLKKGEGASLDALLGFEGEGARSYWGALASSNITPDDFTGRHKYTQAKDVTNIALNYAYSLLFTEMAKAVATTGLEPVLGFYHEPHRHRASLICDLVEEWRAWTADRLVFKHLSHLEIDAASHYLSNDSSKHLRHKWRELMEEKGLHRGEERALYLIMQSQAHSLVQAYNEREPERYEPIRFTRW